MQPLSVLIVGVGGLGKCMVQEALERGLRVSVLVRNEAKLEAELGENILAKLSKITVGDGTNARVLDEAMSGIDVVLSGRGADPHLAQELAAAVKRIDVKKLCWPGGTTNVLADDGVTPNYRRLLHLGSWVEGAYRAHGACIDAIRQADINYVIFYPGRMASVGRRSPDVRASVRINRDSGPFASYEDAAWVMLEAATTNNYDRQLVSAATKL
ncbi:NAD(P)-dependent oxidoreductase [Ralstonia nicotianae]